MNVLDLYIDQEKMYSMEGPSGVRKFTKIINVLGYKTLEEFLEDNSGCMEAMLGFVHNWTERNAEWKAALTAELTDDPIDDESHHHHTNGGDIG